MKSLINTENGSDISQVSPVLSCIHSLNESGFMLEEDRYKYVKSLSLKQLKADNEISKKDGFWFAVSLRDGACLYTSNAIEDHLGYPMDMLVGQCFMSLLYQKDHITFANHLTQGLNACFTLGNRDDSHLLINTFFCRIRVYHGLNYGYSIVDCKPQYKSFKIILHINELILDDVCVEKPSATLCVRATATQVLPAYSIPNEIPAMTSFSTRHTASCHFSHVDACAIPYIGCLPQDMIGFSVFNFYHVDDMPQLKEIYEMVIKEHGTSFRGKPYRFKVHNGHYIMLETEWSCFINPWSHKLEFVVGQHRVLKGPSDINIFTPWETSETFAPNEIIKESLDIQKEIKAILSQKVEHFELKKNKRICNKRKRDLASLVSSYIDETHKENADEDNMIDDEGSHVDADSVVMGAISPYRETNDENISSPTVQQMRYKENIERFFASQPKTYSDGSDDFTKNEKSSSVEEYQGSSSFGSENGSGSNSGNGSGSNSGSGNASSNSKDIHSASPNSNQEAKESGSSSSKYNRSSFTTGDSGYGKSWGKNGNNDPGSSQVGQYVSARMDTSFGNDNDNNNLDNNKDSNKGTAFASCLALTEESLSAHDKINHKQTKQRNSNSTYNKTTAVTLKNTNHNESGYSKVKKMSLSHNATSQPPTTTESITKEPSISETVHQYSNPKPSQINVSNSAECAAHTTDSCNHHNIYPASGASPSFFIPVIMGSLPCFPVYSVGNSFCQCAQTNNNCHASFPLNPTCNSQVTTVIPTFPFPTFPSCNGTSCNHIIRSSGVTTTSLHSTTTTTVASGTSTIYKNTMTGKRGPLFCKISTSNNKRKDLSKQDSDGNESYMQIDESASSITKSSSHQSQDKDEDMDLSDKRFYRPSTLDKIELSPDIAYRYQMNVTNIEDVLKKDRELLKRMQQPELVNKQLEVLQNEIQEENDRKARVDNDFNITEEIMLGQNEEESVNEELENREASLLQFMCGDFLQF